MDELFPASLAMIQSSVAQNNAFSAEQAQKQMDFQREMSNTAHQREIADLKAAGLNPVLSAKLGGASTPSGASASADTSGTSAIATLASEMMRQVASGFASGAFGAGWSRPEGTSGLSVNNDVGNVIWDPIKRDYVPFDIKAGIQPAKSAYDSQAEKDTVSGIKSLGYIVSRLNPVAGGILVSSAKPVGQALYGLKTAFGNGRLKLFGPSQKGTSMSAKEAYRGSGPSMNQAQYKAVNAQIRSIFDQAQKSSGPYR